MAQLVPDFVVTRSFVFKDLAREFSFVIPRDNLPLLQTVELVLYGTPELDSAHGADDVRIQVNGRDITDFVRDALTKQLKALTGPDFGARYSTAMGRWLQYQNAFGVLPEWLQSQQARAAELAQSPPDQLLKKLGNKDSGDAGELDILNFIYRDIALLPVDIHPTLTVADLEDSLTLIISSGPSWRLNLQDWSPEKSYGRGAVSLSLRATFTNPLEDELETVENEVTDALRDLSSRIGSVGDIEQDIQRLVAQLAVRVDDCTQAVGDPAIVGAIQQAVNDIKRALNIP